MEYTGDDILGILVTQKTPLCAYLGPSAHTPGPAPTPRPPFLSSLLPPLSFLHDLHLTFSQALDLAGESWPQAHSDPQL